MLAQQILKDPYTFDFLSLGPDMLERDLERGMIEHLRSLILELGKGFAFVGSQYHLEVGGQDYYLDLLFYHLRLRCFVVIELKIERWADEREGADPAQPASASPERRATIQSDSIDMLAVRAWTSGRCRSTHLRRGMAPSAKVWPVTA